jgi:hypothetical protein
MATRIERTTSLPSTPSARAVSAPTVDKPTTAGMATAIAPVADSVVEGAVAQKTTLAPKGSPVRGSADPGALWGERAVAPVGEQLDVEAFKKLSPEQMKSKLAELEGERDTLRGQVQNRIGQLDRKWNHSRLATRTEALREFQEGDHGLEAGANTQLDQLVARAEDAQRRINVLRARADSMGKTPADKQANAAARHELAKQLVAARKAQSAAVKEATTAVDANGLKVDRLATTEQTIDPGAPAKGSGKSLLDLVTNFFHLNWLIDAFHSVFKSVNTAIAERSDKHAERVAEDQAHDADLRRFEKRLRIKEQLEAEHLAR